MKRYADWAPTGFDSRGAFLPDRAEWLVVPVTRTRDSGDLAASNFETAWSLIEDASVLDNELSCESHRFGHWGPGWFELILVRPGSHCTREAERIEARLADYPILDEDDFSQREWETACKSWAGMRVRDRVALIRECRTRIPGMDLGKPSIFAARRDELPDDPEGYIWERLTSD